MSVVKKKGKVSGVAYKIVEGQGYLDLLYMKCGRKFDFVSTVQPGVTSTAIKQYARQHKRTCGSSPPPSTGARASFRTRACAGATEEGVNRKLRELAGEFDKLKLRRKWRK